ncbi:MAG: YicC family protein [Bacteroidetes bacterium]|nr:YicC family protein [Bacteroidota bacterium]
MTQSMTGFGKGEAVVGAYSATAEIRSVNSRYLEISVKLPQNLSSYEMEVRETIRQQIGRGKLSVLVSTTGSQGDMQVTVDSDSVKRVMSLLQSLKKTTKISSPIKLDHVLIFKDLFKGGTAESQNGDEWEAAKGAIAAALAQLQQARAAEGLALKADLSKRIEELRQALTKIERLSRDHVDEEKSRLRQKVNEVLNGKEVDPVRIELEIVLLADKLDITEEVVRFRTHTNFFMQLLDGSDSNGRRLNFLIQEMNREANTMGSKAFDADMSHLVVEMKEELEKIREQVQNLE